MVPDCALKGPVVRAGRLTKRVDPGLRLVVALRLWRACLEVGCALSGAALLSNHPDAALTGLTAMAPEEREREREKRGRDCTCDEAYLGSPLVPSQDNHFLLIFLEHTDPCYLSTLSDAACQNIYGPRHTRPVTYYLSLAPLNN